MNSVRSSNLSLKYTPSGCKDKWITKFEFVAKTQNPYLINLAKASETAAGSLAIISAISSSVSSLSPDSKQNIYGILA